MNRNERMKLKGWICVLGIMLLTFLFLGRLAILTKDSGEYDEHDNEPESHVPVVEKLSNVWIIEVGEDNVLLYRDGAEESYDYAVVDGALYQPEWSSREQIADVILTDGRVSSLKTVTEKLHGVILSADEASIEIEGYGKIPLASDYRGYRLYNTLEMCSYKDLAFGYDFADLVIDDGEVCGILMVRDETMDSIRVLIKTGDYAGMLHEELKITSDTDFTIEYGAHGQEREETHGAGEEIIVGKDSDYFTGDRIIIKPSALTGKVMLNNVNRSQGIPGYRGHIELIKDEKGIAVINELPLEEYLYSVVPSEMPASYPNEALKAQAICARTYAYGHMQHAAYPEYGAHVDDSTSYQVYNNILEQDSTTQGVKQTHGLLLRTSEGELAGTYYYSTSCGVGSDANVWKTEAAAAITYLKADAINETLMREKLILREQGSENDAISSSTQASLGEYLKDEENFAEFISRTNNDDFDSEEGWYRWSYEVDKISPEHIYEVLKSRYKASANLILTLHKGEYMSIEPVKFSKIKSMYIAARGAGGVADELIIETDKVSYKIISEHNIRYVLCDGKSKVNLANGNQAEMPNLLPSGFFVMETGKKNGNVVGYTLTGGGFGHGVGMSQNGAKNMARKGYSCEEILMFFYEGCGLDDIYSDVV